MADPISIAMIGAAGGAMLSPKDPIKGALLGATAGFGGGALLGAGAAGAAGGAAAGSAAAPALLGAPIGSLAGAGSAAGTYGAAAAPSLLSSLGGMATQAGTFMQQNPTLTGIGLQTAQSLLPEQTPAPQSAGLMRGSPSQMAYSQYQYGAPKISLI